MDESIDLPRGWQSIAPLTVGLKASRGVMAPMVTYETYVRERRSADLSEAPKRPAECSRGGFRFPRCCTLNLAS